MTHSHRFRGISKRCGCGWRSFAAAGANDARRLAGILPLQQRLESRARDIRARGRRDAELTRHRWMLEEYRVSVFAQELGTAFSVSRKKLDEQWSRVAAL